MTVRAALQGRPCVILRAKKGLFRNGVDTVRVADKALAERRRLESADEAEVLAEGQRAASAVYGRSRAAR